MKIKESVIDQKTIVGLKISTSNTNELDPESALIPILWQQFFSEGVTDKIFTKINENVLFGVYTDYDNDQNGRYCVIAGHEVAEVNSVPEGLVIHEIPTGPYLVFSQEGEMPGVIYSLWQHIWEYFSTDTPYQRAFTTDFEVYNNDEPNRIGIYVAIEPVQ